MPVHRDHNVPYFQPGDVARASRKTVRNDDSPCLRKAESGRQDRRYCLCAELEFCSVHVSILSQVLIDKADDFGGYRKSQSFTSTPLTQDECVHSNHMTIEVHQGAAAVAPVDWRIGLNVDHWYIRIGLSPHGTDHAHCDRTLQPLGTANGDYQLSRAHRSAILKKQCRKIVPLDFQDSQISRFIHSYQLCIENLLLGNRGDFQGRLYGWRGKDHPNVLCSFNHMSIGNDVAVGIDNHS